MDIKYSSDYKTSYLELDSGCYKGGEVGFYVNAKPDILYKFDYVPIEVRSKYDPYTSLAEAGYEVGGGNDHLLLISYVLIIATACFAIFTFFSYKKSKGESAVEARPLHK